MNAEQGTAFLKALGVKVASTGSGWLRAKCPLSPFTHAKGADSSPSFGLTIDASKHSTYHCFACQTGSPGELLQALEMHSDYGKKFPGLFNFTKAREILEHEELVVVPLPDYSEFMVAQDKKVFSPLDESTLTLFAPAHYSSKARRYLYYRGFGVDESLKHNLRYSKYDGPWGRLVCPYRNVYNQLAGFRGRLIDFGGTFHYLDKNGEQQAVQKHHDFTLGETNNAYHCWYNEPCLNDTGPVVVVEGQFDMMRVGRVFPRVVANMTAKVSKAKLQKLAYADMVIFLLDNDKTGIDAVEGWSQELEGLGVKEVLAISIADAPKSKHHTARDGAGAPKDPDEVDEGWLFDTLKPYI